MNRIVLIGNGFDLAHGLKTSYKDFIEWYWRDCGKRLLHGIGGIIDDGICVFKLNYNVGLVNWYDVWQYYYVKRAEFGPWDELEVLEIAKRDRKLCDFPIKNSLFQKICNEMETKNWVDIEIEYYSYLKSCDDPKRVNDEFEYIKKKLIEYLKTISSTTPIPVIQKQITEPIDEEDISVSSTYKWDDIGTLKDTMLLNFNYTNTVEMYLQKTDGVSINYIHGRLSEPNSVIFGYGDEKDREYQRLIDENDNEYLRHIKSFRYQDTSNCRKLLSFINSAPYQLCIMGHSCGISDRTLLSKLFEHTNCISIKPYYYQRKDGTDNYSELVQNIARNISDQSLVQDRVVGKERCEALGL